MDYYTARSSFTRDKDLIWNENDNRMLGFLL